MPKLVEKYIPSYDGLLLLYRKYGIAPKEGQDSLRIRGNLCLVHGFGEHSDRYVHVCEEFTKIGFVVHTIDLRGHGYSGGGRADGKFDDILKDIGILLQRADPSLPVFVYGHSMGGMAVLKYMQEHPHCRVDGAIIASPLLALTKPIPWWKRRLLDTCTPVFGEFLISSGIDPCGLSGLHEEVTKVFHDRLSLPFMTVRFAHQMLGAADQTRQRPHLINLPVLFVHGDRDEITNAKVTAAFSQEVASDDVTLLVVEGALHELHNDRHMADTIGTLCRWLETHVDAIEADKKTGRYHSKTLRRASSTKHNNKSASRKKKSVNDKLLMAVYALVALLWLTPLAPILFVTHLAYILLCAIVLDYDLTLYDVAMIMAFGLLHVLRLARVESAPNSGADQVANQSGGLQHNGMARTSSLPADNAQPPAYPNIEVETKAAAEAHRLNNGVTFASPH